MLDQVKLDILRRLREDANLTQTEAARLCGLTSKQGRISLGAWEQGKRIPHTTRRQTFIAYLWDNLGLRKDPAQFEDVWSVLVEEWGWAPIGDREWDRFTVVERPSENGAGQLTNGANVEVSAGKASSPFQAPTNIPHFVGREEEMEAARQRLTTKDGPSTLAFVGMGGIGKTTLAIHVAHALHDHFADGILWATAAITNPLDIAQSWAQAYGYDFSGLTDLESRAAAIRNVLAEKRALIVFDDVIDAAAIRPLLPGGETCRVVITTRNHDIASSLNAEPIAPSELAVHAGVDLLVRVLGALRVDAEFAAAERICEIVEGLPLAVEIVAQRLFSRPQQSLGNMVNRLEDSSQRLGLEISDRAIRAAFEVSWAQLNDEQKEVFSQMGVFEGRSFAIPALAYIGERSEPETEDLVWGLQALSLVRSDGDGRYRQHPLIADFAGEGLTMHSICLQNLADYYIVLATQQNDQSERLYREVTNIYELICSLSSLAIWQPVIDLTHLVANTFISFGVLEKIRRAYELAISASKEMKNQEQEADFLIKLAEMCCDQGDHSEAEALLNKGIKICKKLHYIERQADAEYLLARVASIQAEYEEADEKISNCIEIREQLDNQVGLAKAMYLRAEIIFRQGDSDRSEKICQESLAVQIEYRQTADCLATIRLLIEIALFQRQFDIAKGYCINSLERLNEEPNLELRANLYFSLATVHRYLNELDKALSYARKSLKLYEYMGNRAHISYLLYEQSVILSLQKKTSHALELGLSSLSIMTELQDDYSRVYCLQFVGDLFQQNHEQQSAVHHWQQGRLLAQEIHHPRIELLNERLGIINGA